MSLWRRKPKPPFTRMELLEQAYRALDDVWFEARKDKRGLPAEFFTGIIELQSRLMDAWEDEARREQVIQQRARERAEEDVRHERP